MSSPFPEKMIVVGGGTEGILGGQTESSCSEDERSPRRTGISVPKPPPPTSSLAEVPLEDATGAAACRNPMHIDSTQPGTPHPPRVRPGHGVLLSQTLSASTYPTAIRYAMEIAETCDLKGVEKKAFALELMTVLVKEGLHDPSGHVATALHNGAMADLIDNLACAAKGNTSIHRSNCQKYRASCGDWFWGQIARTRKRCRAAVGARPAAK